MCNVQANFTYLKQTENDVILGLFQCDIARFNYYAVYLFHAGR